jgi:hypothetical protein
MRGAAPSSPPAPFAIDVDDLRARMRDDPDWNDT